MSDAKPRQRRKADRPQEILAAASALFSEKGYTLTQMSDIATRAGIAKGTVYLYFSTKQELFEELVRMNVSPVFERLAELLAANDAGAGATIKLILRMMYRELVDSPHRRAVMRVLIADGAKSPELVEYYYREILQNALRLVQQVLAEGVRRGEIRDCPAVRDPRPVMGPAVMAAVWRMTFDAISPLDIESFLETHVDLVLNGLLRERTETNVSADAPAVE